MTIFASYLLEVDEAACRSDIQQLTQTLGDNRIVVTVDKRCCMS